MMVGRVQILAPGKLILAGEYAVLEGATGIVMAVDRYAALAVGGDGPFGLVDEARAAAARRLQVQRSLARWTADSSALCQGPETLGLGSSAAVAAGAVASLYLEEGRSIEDHETRAEMWEVARAAHDAHQGAMGSGIDVAASLFGGTIVMRGAASGRPSFQRWSPPPGVRFAWVWTGRASSTPVLVRAVRDHARRDPTGHRALTDEMALVSEAVVEASDPGRLIASIRRYGELMGDLGRLAGVEVVTGAMKALSDTATRLGGAAKPSGAGGGDIVMAVFEDDVAASRFADHATAMGLGVLRLGPAPQGVHARIATGVADP